MPRASLVRMLARSFLAGEPAVDRIVARAAGTLGRPWPWLTPLARRYVSAFAGATRPRHREVVQFLIEDPGFGRASRKYFQQLSVEQWLPEPNQMQPVAAAAAWDLPALLTVGELAEWLQLTAGELEWFADLKGLGCRKRQPQLDHYHYRVLAKRYDRIRLIEAPKLRLKQLQRQILSGILERVPPHLAAHGFVKRRSIRTFVTPHVGRRVVLRMDLEDFFPSFSGARIQAFFRTAGYPESVADLLGGICTNAAPRHIWNEMGFDLDRHLLHETRSLYARPHLPQGAPTSPALANICSYRLDCRLTGLAQAAGAVYTRYADDLAFSGDADFERRVERFSTHVAAILLDEGLAVNHHKTRIMRQGVRQRLAGIVANRHMNVARADFDRLKARLTNCVRRGPESQNREAHPQFRAHLEGCVAFLESINPSRGRRLRSILEQIRWP